jgi:hypothetical protein
MFIKKFNSFLNESLQLGNGNIIDEEDVEDVFHDFLEDLPELKDAKIEFLSNDSYQIGYLFQEKGIKGDFQINFILDTTNISKKMKNNLYVRFNGFYHTKHDPLFKTDILDEIDNRMQDQFEYQLKDKTWYGGSNFLGVGFIFGKIEKGYKRDSKKEKSDYKGPRTHTPKRRDIDPIIQEGLSLIHI